MILLLWSILKITFVTILLICAIIFFYNFFIGIKIGIRQAASRVYDYSIKHLIQKKNNDGLLYELDREKKICKI